MVPVGSARLLKEFPESLNNGTGAVFVGAGVSMSAGYPSWSALLREIGEELGVGSSEVSDLAALAQWSIQESGSATRVRNVIRDHIGRLLPVPPTLEILARLPVRHIWTTNYDRLIERAFEAIGRPIDSISGAKDLALRATPGAVRLYKMHGSVDRLDDVVISTDDYELYRSRRGSYLPLLQAHLTSMSMLFVGLSFTDPNVRHVLSLIRESFTDAPPEHFAIVRAPHETDYSTAAEFNTRAAQHSLWTRDLRRYGLVAVEVDTYDEVPALMKRLERRVASKRVWVSGSWPITGAVPDIERIHDLAAGIGKLVGDTGRTLVTGSGLIVGSATVAGLLDSLRSRGTWDLERRLVARPFPMPMPGEAAALEQWSALREELARLSGVVIFVGGTKLVGGALTMAEGVLQEADLAQSAECALLPIGATGGAAEAIATRLLGSALASHGPTAVRPTDDELRALSDKSATVDRLIELVSTVLARFAASS